MITVFVFQGKKGLSVSPKAAAKLKRAESKKQHPVEKNPRVTFYYPSSDHPGYTYSRNVRVIGANEKYIVGLDIGDKNRFKRFRKDRMTNVQLMEFNPLAAA